MTTALSWSRVSDYRQCPHKFRGKYIEKWPEFKVLDKDKNPHLVRGDQVHKQLQKYVRLKLDGIPTESVVFLPEVDQTIPLINGIMDNYGVIPEQQIAIDENFQRVNWFSDDAWFRVIIDLIGHGQDLFLGDYKTGKMNDYSGSLKELGQLHMTAVVGMAIWPEYDECSSLYIYVDHKKTVPCKLRREDAFETMRERLQEEHALINDDDEYVERKNQFCKWCDALPAHCVHKRKG